LIGIAPDAIQGGANIVVPIGAMSLVGIAPVIRVGSLVDVPTGTISLLGLVPQILQSANILVGVAQASLVGLVPDTNSGAFIDNPSRQDSYTSFGGGVAEASVGEFAVGEGIPEVTLSGRRAARLPVQAHPPTIQAGKLVDVPAGVLQLAGRIPELDVRRRKLRARVILS
jgi:hypothetical protein